MSVPSGAEVEHADWPTLQGMCRSLGLNPKGRSGVVRMRVLEHVRRRGRPQSWRAGRDHMAALLTRLGFPDLAEDLWETAIRRLGMLGGGREDVQNHLLDLLSDPYLLVQLAVVRTLSSFADERVTEALMKYTTGDLDGRLKRAAEEAVRKIRKGMEQEFPTAK